MRHAQSHVSLFARQGLGHITAGDILQAHMRRPAIRIELPAPHHDGLAVALVGFLESPSVDSIAEIIDREC